MSTINPSNSVQVPGSNGGMPDESLQRALVTLNTQMSTKAALSTDSSGNVGITPTSGSGYMLGLNGFVPINTGVAATTYANIIAAFNAAVANGGGTVQFMAETYNIGGNTIPMASGVNYIGATWVAYIPNNVVDDSFVTVGTGTVIQGNSTAPGFYFVGASNQAQGCLDNASIKNLSITGCTYGIQIGGNNLVGGTYCTFDNILITGCSMWGFWVENMIHCRYDHIYAIGCGTSASSTVIAGGGRFVTSINGFANNEIGEVLVTAPQNLLAHSLEIYNRNGASGGIATAQILQGNRFNNPTFTPQTASTTASTANVSVSNGSLFAPDLPIVFTAVGTSGLTVGQVYFVQSVVGNVLTIGNSPEPTDLITFTAGQGSAGNLTVTHYGFPAISVYRATNVNGPDLYDCRLIDAESGGTTKLFISGCNTNLGLYGIGQDASSAVDVTVRNGAISGYWQQNSLTRFDLDGNSAQFCELNGFLSTTNPFSGGYPIILGKMQALPNSARVLNLTQNNAGGYATLINRTPGNCDWTYPGVPIGVKINYITGTGTANTASGGLLSFVGTASSTITWQPGAIGNAQMLGFRQTFKNVGTAACTITLGASDGTFDGMTGGTSSGKSMLLAAPTATTPGGALTIIFGNGNGSNVWQIESLVNATLV
jgi:hypothetical protein